MLDKSIVLCNWCISPGEGTFTIKTQEQIKKFCSESCFSRWRRSIFKHGKICDSCKNDMNNVQSPFFYYLKECDQHFQYCSYICFINFKENLSYNMVKSNSISKIMNQSFGQNMLLSFFNRESEDIENNLNSDNKRREITNPNSKVITMIDILSRKCS